MCSGRRARDQILVDGDEPRIGVRRGDLPVVIGDFLAEGGRQLRAAIEVEREVRRHSWLFAALHRLGRVEIRLEVVDAREENEPQALAHLADHGQRRVTQVELLDRDGEDVLITRNDLPRLCAKEVRCGPKERRDGVRADVVRKVGLLGIGVCVHPLAHRREHRVDLRCRRAHDLERRVRRTKHLGEVGRSDPHARGRVGTANHRSLDRASQVLGRHADHLAGLRRRRPEDEAIPAHPEEHLGSVRFAFAGHVCRHRDEAPHPLDPYALPLRSHDRPRSSRILLLRFESAGQVC